MHAHLAIATPKLRTLISSAARKLARYNSDLAEELAGFAWLRICSQEKHDYELQQWYVVGLNAMRLALRKEINAKHAPAEEAESVPDSTDEAAHIELRDTIRTCFWRLSNANARAIVHEFLLKPDSLTAAARRAGLSAATACRVAAAMKRLWCESEQNDRLS